MDWTPPICFYSRRFHVDVRAAALSQNGLPDVCVTVIERHKVAMFFLEKLENNLITFNFGNLSVEEPPATQ